MYRTICFVPYDEYCTVRRVLYRTDNIEPYEKYNMVRKELCHRNMCCTLFCRTDNIVPYWWSVPYKQYCAVWTVLKRQTVYYRKNDIIAFGQNCTIRPVLNRTDKNVMLESIVTDEKSCSVLTVFCRKIKIVPYWQYFTVQKALYRTESIVPYGPF